MPKHVHCNRNSFKYKIPDKRFVAPFTRFHIDEKNFGHNRTKTLDMDFHRPAKFALDGSLVCQHYFPIFEMLKIAELFLPDCGKCQM